MEITLFKGGTGETTIDVSKIRIPDCWHIANRLVLDERDAVLDCWHLAHELLKHAQSDADLLAALKAVKAFALPGATHIHRICDDAIARAEGKEVAS